MGVFPSLKYLLAVVLAAPWPTANASDHRRVGYGLHRHGLLQQPVEELATVARSPAVEAEGELVEVVVEVLATDRTLVCSH